MRNNTDSYKQEQQVETLLQQVRLADKAEDPQQETLLLKALTLSKQNSYLRGVADCQYELAKFYKKQFNFSKAVEYLSPALDQFEQLQLDGNRVACYRLMADIHFSLKNYNAAINWLRRALEINRVKSDQQETILDLRLLGRYFIFTAEHEKAIAVFREGLETARRIKNPLFVLWFSYYLGNALNWADQIEESEKFLMEAFHQNEVLNDTDFRFQIIGSLGILHRKKKDYAKALELFNSALELMVEDDSLAGKISLLNGLGNLYVDMKDWDNALKTYKNALARAEQYKTEAHPVTMTTIHESLAKVYAHLGDYKSAYEEYQLFHEFEREKNMTEINTRARFLSAKEEVADAMRDKELAEHKSRLKEQFLTNMSHEIRTPIHAIVGVTNLMMQTEHSAQQEKYLDVVKKSAENLLVIINDILDFSKIEAGKLVVEKIDFDLAQMVDLVYNTLRFKAEEKGIELRYSIEEDVPPIVIGDPTRLNQILNNLVGNALKFTHSGYVKLHLRSAGMVVNENHKTAVEFIVSDTGIGISEEQLPKIFESFTQAGADTTRKYGGTGLGLTISKQLIELQGGSIAVKSKKGEGTTFTFFIPYEVGKQVDLPEKIHPHELSTVARLRNLNILLVEDNKFNQMVAVDTLEQLLEDCKITIAENGKEAIQQLRQNSFDVVLMDVQMPEMDGYETTRFIRSQFGEPVNKIPVIALTANATTREIDRCFAAGMNEYVSKPFEPKTLLEKISALVALPA